MDLVGKMLAGRYEILEEVGKGGMAHVYKAHCHFLNRPVAIKVLKEELRDDKEFVQRFNTEAQAAARISNPHIVSIYDVGVENGLYYIVMEFVEGITLKEYIADKRVLPWKQAADFAAQICEGLDAAHKKSVIHRDIKPQNIIMTKGDVLKITDFGIARASTQATITTANTTIGTVHYLSPEQARGGYTNERTDIYSLGVVLYEMLTGRLPFDDNTAVAIAIKHIQEKPVLPRILNNDIPQAMEDIVMKALNKEQDRRYASAAEFLEDLRKVLKNPNVRLASGGVMTDDDIGVTRKRAAIDIDADDYAKRIDAEMAEREMRNIDRKKAVREQKKKERRVTIAAIAAAIIVIAALGTVFSALSGGGLFGVFTQSEKIEIPNVVDMKLADAQNKYNMEGISILKASEKSSDLPAGTILEQDPAAGESVARRDDIIIRVVVSAGEQNKTVGKYTEMKVDEAKTKIARDGFKVNIVEVESSSEKEGTVISQSPAEGAKASEGAMITLNVSKGEKKDDEDKKEEETTKTSNSGNNSNNSNNSTGSNSNNSSNTNTGSNSNSGQSNSNTGSNSGNGNSTASDSNTGSGNSNSTGGNTAGSGTGGNSGSSESGTGSSTGSDMPTIRE